MSFRGRPKTSCLSNEEIIQQKQKRLEAQEKAKKERAEKRKLKNKGYGSQERKPCTRKESLIPVKPSSTRHETSNFGARFPVEGSSTPVFLNNEESHHLMECEPNESIHSEMEIPQIFPADYTKEFIDNQEECISFLKFTEKDFPETPVKTIIKEKKIRDDDVESGWDVTKTESAYKAAVEAYGCKWSHCHVCFSEANIIVKCTDCRLAFCSECDEKEHSVNPFCHRNLHCKDSKKWIKSQSLLPTEFLNCLDGTVVSKAVPVPLFPAGPCPECSKVGVLGNVEVTSNTKHQLNAKDGSQVEK